MGREIKRVGKVQYGARTQGLRGKSVQEWTESHHFASFLRGIHSQNKCGTNIQPLLWSEVRYNFGVDQFQRK